MLVELRSEDFSHVRPLLGEISYNLVVPSILEGNTLGKLFVSNEEKPDSVIVWNCGDTVLIGGDPGEGYREEHSEFLKEKLIPSAKARGIPVLNFYSTRKAKSFLKHLLDSLEPRPVLRYLFRSTLSSPALISDTSEDTQTKRITREILEGDFRNIDRLKGWILSFWPDLETFLDKSMGTCLTRDNQIVSWCIGVYRSANSVELGVETVIGFRRMGYAKRVVRAAAEESHFMGLTVDWQCDASNNPSVTIAKSLRFQEVLQYTISQIELRKQRE